MGALLIAHDYPGLIEPAEVLQVLDDLDVARKQKQNVTTSTTVAVGVNAERADRKDWQRLAEQLDGRGIDLRFEPGCAGWEARLYTAGDQLSPQITGPPGGRDGTRPSVLHEVPEPPEDHGPEAGQDGERPAGDEGDLPGLRDEPVPDRGGELAPDPPSAEPETAPAAAHAEPPPGVTPPGTHERASGGVTPSPWEIGLPALIRTLAEAGLSTRKIAAELAEQGVTVSHMKVARVLRANH